MKIILSTLCSWLMFLGVAFAASVTIAPTTLNIAIPTGQTSAWGSIISTNTGTTSVTLTWADSIDCLRDLTPLMRTLSAGASTTWTIRGICVQSGNAFLAGSGISITIPVSIMQGAAAIPGPPGTPIVTMKPSPILGSALLGWDANKEMDLAGYRVYMGTAPRTYNSISVLPKDRITATANNLQPGKTYFFAVTAFDSSNNESPFSTELSKTVP